MSAGLKSSEVIEKNDGTLRVSEKEKTIMDEKTMAENRESENDLVNMAIKLRTEAELHNSQNHMKHKAELEIGRDNYERTGSMLSYLSGVEEDEIMTNTYKYITTAVLWFCYFSLALNDYIFGPTFDDLTKQLNVKFQEISYFTIIRQVSYTFGALGGVAFNYINRQLALAILLIISAFTLVATPYATSINIFFVIGAINGFAAGACDIGFHVWIIEMFEDGGGPLLQALHFSFGLGMTIAPTITAPFLSGEGSECSKVNLDKTKVYDNYESYITFKNTTKPESESSETSKSLIYIPYVICAAIVCSGGIFLIILYIYKKYVPPRQPRAPQAFAEEMPEELHLTKLEKFEVWRQNIPSSYTMSLIILGSLLLLIYYGLEVTYFQFMAQFITATPLPIQGTQAALVETATGASYAFGGAISIYLSTRLIPSQMLYFNFVVTTIGYILLMLFYSTDINMLWVGNVLVGLGFSSIYASCYTFLEHHITVNNAIGALFVLAGGAGTAILPLFLSTICQSPATIIIMAFICISLTFVLFLTLNIMTNIRSKQIDMIKKQLISRPAILLGYREKSMSILTM